MANELPNAILLRQNAEWREWLITAAAYVARLVIVEPESTEDHEIRVAMARVVAVTPEQIAPILVTMISTDPEVCGTGNTPQQIGQSMVLQKVQAAWTHLAKLLYR